MLLKVFLMLRVFSCFYLDEIKSQTVFVFFKPPKMPVDLFCANEQKQKKEDNFVVASFLNNSFLSRLAHSFERTTFQRVVLLLIFCLSLGRPISFDLAKLF